MGFGGGLAGLPELFGFAIAGGQEGNGVHAEDRVFVRITGNDDFTDLGLPALNRTLDFVGLEQGTAVVNGQRQFATGGLFNILGKKLDVGGVEVGRRIAGRHVPFLLGKHGG